MGVNINNCSRKLKQRRKAKFHWGLQVKINIMLKKCLVKTENASLMHYKIKSEKKKKMEAKYTGSRAYQIFTFIYNKL